MKLSNLSLVMAGLCTCLTTAFSQQVTDFNFDNLSLGSTPPTTTPGVDGQPQHTVYAINGFPDTGPYSGSVTVQDVGGMNHAAQMDTTQAGIGAQYIDTQFLATSPKFDLSFDLNVLSSPTSATDPDLQQATGAPLGQAFALQAFGLDTNRVLRFAAAPTSGTGGEFAFRLPGGTGALTDFFPYVNGQTYHLDFQIDFGSGTANVFVNNTLALPNAPLVNPGTGLSELFFFQNDLEGVLNSVAIDNIELAAVPEASTWATGMLAAVALGIFALRRRRASA